MFPSPAAFEPKDKRQVLVEERVRKQVAGDRVPESIEIAVSAVVISADAVGVAWQQKHKNREGGDGS